MADDTHGSARFATNKEVAPLTRPDTGLLIGRDGKTGKLLRYDGSAHLLTMAPTRTDKGDGTASPDLLIADRSVISIDPKGENAKIAGRAREQVGPVHVLDPFGVTAMRSAAFDPLDTLDPSSLDIAEDASTLADALVFDEPAMAVEAHCDEEAKVLIARVLLKIVAVESPGRRHLGTLREYLTVAPETFAALLERMQESNEAGGLIARAANRHLGTSDFRFADLKHSNVTVFLVLPPNRFSTYSRWLRLLVSQSLLDMARDPAKPATPVLYLLDEFAALGHLAPVERAMGLMAGYGIRLWPILQDVQQLRAARRHLPVKRRLGYWCSRLLEP